MKRKKSLHLQFSTIGCTLCSDRLGHRAGVAEPLSVHGPDDEQVDRVGS